MSGSDNRTHEITFCSSVSKWADSIFEKNPAWSFKRTDIEQSKGIKKKRSDLRIYGDRNKLILAGEVNTVFFRQSTSGKAVTQPLHLSSRAHAETVCYLAQRGIHGTLKLPKTEKAARGLRTQLAKRVDTLATKAKELSRSRTGDEKKALELARLLEFWMAQGKPAKTPKPQALE